MIEVRLEEEKKVTCLLIGAPEKGSAEPKGPVELKGLIHTLGMECAGIMVLNRIEPTPAYGIGSGKAQEIADLARELNADCIIFDWEIDPSKQRNWEKLASRPVFDRNEVIIRIFAQRAQTKEAALQVELARLTYSLPRLSHMYGDMARQRGGAFGAKGSGETKLELDRRQIEEKILQIKKELHQVEVTRQTQRKMREKTALASCALVGYTNAGKSSLLNALTGADAFVEDKLFATLDPTTRKLSLAEGSTVLLTDTVGFISNLPHTLIDAFRSTLEEASLADLLLLVIDSSDENCVKQYEQVMKVLREIKADGIEKILVLNKCDALEDLDEERNARISFLKKEFPGSVFVSAKSGEGFEELLDRVKTKLLGEVHSYIVPMELCERVELARRHGTILSEEWLDDGIHITARIPGQIDEEGGASTRTLSLLAKFRVQE